MESLPQPPLAPEEALKQVDLFVGVTEHLMRELLERGTQRHYGDGEEVVAQGSDDAALYVILAGEARVVINEVERAVLGPGGYFGELSWMDPAPRSASIVASGVPGLDTFRLGPESFTSLSGDAEFVKSVLTALILRLRELELTDVTWAFASGRPPAHGEG